MSQFWKKALLWLWCVASYLFDTVDIVSKPKFTPIFRTKIYNSFTFQLFCLTHPKSQKNLYFQNNFQSSSDDISKLRFSQTKKLLKWQKNQYGDAVKNSKFLVTFHFYGKTLLELSSGKRFKLNQISVIDNHVDLYVGCKSSRLHNDNTNYLMLSHR